MSRTRTSNSNLAAGAATLLLLCACESQTPQPSAQAAGSQTANPQTATGTAPSHLGMPPGHGSMMAGGHGADSGGATEKPSSIAWRAPASLVLVPSPSSMRLATYRFNKVDGDSEDAELSVTQVGGDIASNISRWSTQFEGSPMPKTSERTVSGLKVTIVELDGTYAGMAMPGQPGGGTKEGYALLAAIVESQKGQSPHFFKMTGPKRTVDAARGAFDELVGTVGEK